MALLKNIATTLFDAYFPFLSVFMRNYKIILPMIAILITCIFIGAVYAVSSLISLVF